MSDTPVQITGTLTTIAVADATAAAPAAAAVAAAPSPVAARTVIPDFVNVRLNADGKAFAGESGTVRVGTGLMHYMFEGDTPQRVVYRGDWTEVLAPLGLFEIVADAPAPAQQAPAASALPVLTSPPAPTTAAS